MLKPVERAQTYINRLIEKRTHKIGWLKMIGINSADVAPVVHGRWVFGKDLPDSFGSINKNKYHLYCSECRNQAFNNSTDNDCDFDMDTPFCPWCGAKMDGDVDNG